MKARALVFRGPGIVDLEVFDLRDPGDGEVLVEIHHSCISPGTELRCLAGKQPGSSPWPFIPGYAAAGRVVVAGPGASVEPGTWVYLNGTSASGHLARMWGGHVSHAVAPSGACLRIPNGLTTAEASLAHLAGIAYHGCAQSGARAGDSVVVIGLGVLGQLCASLYRVLGCRVVACDVNESRVSVALQMGLDAVLVKGSLAGTVRDRLADGPDVIADVTGNARVVAQAIELAREVPWDDRPSRSTTYVVQGSYPDVLPVPYQEAFMKQLRVIFPRDCTAGDRMRAMELMAGGELRAGDFIAHRSPEAAQEIYRELTNPLSKLLTVAFGWV